MIDGGKGQVNIVKAELFKLNLESIKIIGVSKGSSRIPGNEKIIIEEAKIIKKLRKDSMASHLIQTSEMRLIDLQLVPIGIKLIKRLLLLHLMIYQA